MAELFLSFDGRLRRADFWIGFLILTAAGFALTIVQAVVLGIGPTDVRPWWVTGLAFVVMWLQAPLYAKRLHDRGRSGWPAIIPFAGGAVLVAAAPWLQEAIEAGGVAVLAVFAVTTLGWSAACFWLFVEAGFLGPRESGASYARDRPFTGHGRGLARCLGAGVLGALLALLPGPDSRLFDYPIESRVVVELSLYGAESETEERSTAFVRELLELEGVAAVSSVSSPSRASHELVLREDAVPGSVLAELEALAEARTRASGPIEREDLRWTIRSASPFGLRVFVRDRTRTVLLPGLPADHDGLPAVAEALRRDPRIAWAGAEGAPREVLVIEASEDQLRRHGLTVEQVGTAIRRAAGRPEAVEAEAIRTAALQELAGATVTIGDVCRVTREVERGHVSLPQYPAGALCVLRASDASWDAVADLVRGEFEALGCVPRIVDEASAGNRAVVALTAVPGVSDAELVDAGREFVDATARVLPPDSICVVRYLGIGRGRPAPAVLECSIVLDRGSESRAADAARELVSVLSQSRFDTTFDGPFVEVKTSEALARRREVQLLGDSWIELAELEDRLRARLGGIQGLHADPVTVLGLRPELEIVPDPDKVLALGLSVEGVAEQALAATRRGGHDIAELGDLAVSTTGGSVVRLRDIADVRLSTRPAQLAHIGTRRGVVIRCSIDPGVSESGVDARVSEAIAEVASGSVQVSYRTATGAEL